MSKVTLEMSKPAAVFLRAAMAHMNQAKHLPDNDVAALMSSSYLEEIEHAADLALREER